MIYEQFIDKDMKEVGRGLTWGGSRRCPGGTERKHEIPHSG